MLPSRPLDLGLADFRLDKPDNRIRDAVLELEDTRQVAIEPIHPKLRIGVRVDLLNSDLKTSSLAGLVIPIR
ncbi:hypothetical protein [Rhizobium lentis]|uniref:hypothetical protein n=1 Tax=Rhizobium lentis TaxID=1138194 RepID=UPI001C830D5B|nr:hypothetical protein [Rhizobium lentis]MBX4999062.1 hypothetical protein [Rhizobium lentis]MBX5017973.1 hypothetical protein [Rhizobium lentis]